MTTHPLIFDDVVRELPDCCGFDPLAQTTVEDLVWLATIELDLHEEGQDGCCTKREANKLRRFIKKYDTFGIWLPKGGVK